MVMVAPLAMVAPPVTQPREHGLFSVFNFRSGDRFEQGVKWEELGGCDPLDGISAAQCDPADMVGLPKVLEGAQDWADGEALPFTVYADWLCSPVGFTPTEAQNRANARLLKWEQARAEQAFWTGDLLNTPNLSGANGYPAPVSAGTHDTEWHALAAAELGIAVNYGAVGVLHMSIRTASLLLSKGGIQSKGGRLFTELGTPIVAGAGYPDVPEIIGTPALLGYRSEIFTSSNRAGDLFDRGQNDLHAIAERTYLIGFDPCPIVKATYTGIEPTP